MPRPILHSALVPLLRGYVLDDAHVDALLSATSGGVYPEAANQDDADSMARQYPTILAAANGSSATVGEAPPANLMQAEHITSPTFRFGKGSENELVGVHPGLVAVTRLALDMSSQDFVVYEGVRTLKAQVNNVHAGVSKTMHSKHLIQADGFSHAVDLVPYMNGRPTWDWDGCFRIALAMCDAALTRGVAHKLTWGGAWDRRLSDFATLGGSLKIADIKAAVEAYKIRHPGPDFLDGPHFEWEV
jgi:peptidoglycan L-alanyl-D-glutamate endopeptidase CwlK